MLRCAAACKEIDARTNHERLAARFPDNPYVQRLVAKAEALNVSFDSSPVENNWLYHPYQRRLYIWEPDLDSQSLSYLVVILAHELGHAVDFDDNPHHLRTLRNHHWLDVPDEVELAAFVQGFRILKELAIPVSLDHYEQMIEQPMAARVRRQIESNLCCLLSAPRPEPRGGVPADRPLRPQRSGGRRR